MKHFHRKYLCQSKFCVYLRDGFFTILSPREAVSKLRVCKLVQPSSSCNAEVAPYVLIAAEIQLLHSSRAGLETLRSNHISSSHKLNQPEDSSFYI